MMQNLDKINGKSPFRVPENYFDEVTKKIIGSACGNTYEFKKAGPFTRMKPYLATAAFISGIILISYFSLKLIRSNNKDNFIPQISLDYFSDSYLNDIDILTLEESWSASHISEEGTEFSNSDIIDYLLQENISIDEIYDL